MENLPTPLSRVELYLAKACGMDVTTPEPGPGIEPFLYAIAYNTTPPVAGYLTEEWLAYVQGVTPQKTLKIEGACLIGNEKVDVRYFAVTAGVPGATLPPKPQNRKEEYWAYIATHRPTPGILKYVTGKYFYLTDVVSGIEELQYVKGDTSQQTYSGKNLCNLGTKTVYQYELFPLAQTLPAGTYTFSAQVTSTDTQSSVCFIRFMNGSSGVGPARISRSDERTHITVTTSGITDGIYLYAGYDSSGSTGDTATFTDIQIESGSTATSYEPYTGGIPAPNPDYPQPIQVVTGEQTVTIGDGVSSQSYEIDLTGKNLWNPTPYKYGYYLSNSGVETSSAYASIYGNIMVNPNDTLTLSYTPSESGNIRIHAYNASGTWLSLIHWSSVTKDIPFSATFTIPSGATYIRWSCQASIDDNNLAQVELGSATPYTPYYNYELCKIGDYQDYIYKSGGDWYVHKEVDKYVFGGDESWQTTPYGTNSWVLNNVIYFNFDSNKIQIISNIATGIAHADRNTNTPNVMYSGQNVTFNFRNTSFTTLSALQTATKDSYVYYALATPTDTKITDATLISQLNALNSAQLPKPIANITVSATGTNLTPYLTIAYYGSEEE